MSGPFDRRLTPARDDIAAAHLKGAVSAARFVEGRASQAVRGVIDLRKAPDANAPLETQILFGERFTIYDERNGWVWGQAAHDSYVGYARADAFIAQLSAPTHRVIGLSTPLLSGPDVKTAARTMLPLNAKLTVVEEGPRFVRLADGYVFSGHVAPIAQSAPDWVAVAERFLGVPYLWGGKTASGTDCSGLIQTALEAGGISAPRDTDLMETGLGRPVDLSLPLRRGDLIFWHRHMGVMRDDFTLLHANAYFMEVTSEPLETAHTRIAAEGADVRTILRL